jgi:hypothetical protein
MHWFSTTEQLLGLAPDYSIQRAGRTLVTVTDWSHAGWDSHFLWAVFPDARQPPVQTAISLSTLLGVCSCPSAKFPCRHILALLLHRVGQAGPPAASERPDWVYQQLVADNRQTGPIINSHSEQHKQVKRFEDSSPKAESQRLAAIRAGLLELERWLKDLVQQGMANALQKPKRFWLDAADRLVDAYAEPLARDVRELATLPGNGRDWPERVLARLGLLYLFIQGFKRYDQLPPAAQGDLRAAIGWPLPRPSDDPARQVADRWLVLGRRQEVADRRRQQRLWLWGQASERFALLTDDAPVKQNQGLCLPTGLFMQTSLSYYQSNWPLPAEPTAAVTLSAEAAEQPAVGETSIEQAIRGYAQARTANPWLRVFPLALRAVRVERAQASWRVRDHAGNVLPLPPRFSQGWQLLALSTDKPLSLFGEWNGFAFTPLSVHLQGQWHDLHRWRGLV